MEAFIMAIIFAIVVLTLAMLIAIRSNRRERERQKLVEVIKFKIFVLANYGQTAYLQLPTHKEMIKDGRPLTVKAWLDI